MRESIVIIGAGQAAGQAISSLRSGGHTGRITLIGDEPIVPYQRPPLSKKYLMGEFGLDRLFVKPPDFYTQAGVTLRLGTRARRIDRAAGRIETDKGEAIAYDGLILATGSRPRPMPVPGTELSGVHYLRTVADVDRIRAGLTPGARIAIIGGGYIGLEVAAVMRSLGHEVTVIEMAQRCLQRVTSPELSAFFEEAHAKAGVVIRTREAVSALKGHDRLEEVICKSGLSIAADIAIIGIGILPNTELAAEADLAVNNGILVDETAATSDPNICAAGDCTNLPSGLYGRRLRLESVHNAIEQGKTAAATLLGQRVPYDQVPWFWSDQYDLKLQIAGLSEGYDRVVLRGDMGKRSFALFYLREGRLIAVDAVNAAPEYMMGRRLIGEKAAVPPDRLANTAIPMKEMAP